MPIVLTARVVVCLLMAEIPKTHYVKSDDVHIAYQVIGEGPLDLLFVPGFVSNIETIWQSPEQSAFFRRLALFSRLILFDKRGTGMSDRSSQIFTLEQRMHDVQAILDTVGSKRAALFGISEAKWRASPGVRFTPQGKLNKNAGERKKRRYERKFTAGNASGRQQVHTVAEYHQ